MNKIFRIVWSEVSQAWIAVSELTKSHKKRASATAVAVALVAGMLSPFAEASETASGFGVDSKNPEGGYTPPRPTDIEGPGDISSLNGLGFGLVVVDKEGHRKEILPGKKIENTTDDDEKISTVITVEPNNDSAPEPPKRETSYLYLVEGDGVKIDQNGRSAKFSVNTGDGLKIDDNNKVAADTVELTVTNGKVTAPEEVDKKKLVNAGGLESALNKLGWRLKAGTATSTVKSGEEVEFKGEGGVTVTATTDTNGKHVVTIKAEQPQGGSATAGGSTPVTAGDGISVSADNKVSVKAKTDSGITVDASGVSVNAKADGGLTVGADGVSVNAKNNGGIKVDGDGVSVDVDGKTIEVGTDGKVTAKVASAKGLEKTDDGLAIKSKTNGGLTVDADGVSVNAKANGGLTVDGSGVSVNTDGTTITVDTATGNVKAVTGDFNVNAATGATEANDNDGNKLATVTNVANAINAAKVKVEAGSGISVAHNAALNTYTVSAPFEKTENDKGTTVTFKGKTTTEHPNGETKLSGIAAGDISPTSSDAVNGAQIYGLNRGATTKVENVTVAGNTYNNVIVSNDGKNTPLLKTYNTQDKRTVLTNSVYEAIYNMNEYGIKFFHVNDGTENAKREGYSENDSSASGKYATAIGALSDASGQNAVAMGFGSTVTGDNSIAIGTGNQVNAAKSGAFGDPNIINGKDVNNVAVSGSYAVGNDNIIDSSNTFVLGNDINNKGNSTPVGHTVENSVYLGNKTTARGGDGSQTAALKNIKHDGSEGTTTTAGSIGTVNEAIVNGMSYGGFAGAKGHGVVSVGAADAERRIQNVAAGEISATSTDAINGSQLYSISSRLGNNMNSLNDRINKVGKRADAGTASAIATANLLQSYRPGLSAATAAVGQYRGQSAIAVGYSRLSDNGKYGVKFSLGANTQGNVGAGAGVAYFW